MPFTIDDRLFILHTKGGMSVSFQLSDYVEDTDPAYYGYLTVRGQWVIMKKSAGVVTYVAGASDYSTYWAIRSLLTYVQYDELGL